MTRHKALHRIGATAAATLVAFSSFAQAEDEERIEEVDVTGSFIK